MQLNSYELVDRHNRPNTTQRVGLRVFFINDGVYQDPADISSVTVFQKDKNTSPSSILNSSGLIASGTHGNILMHFEVTSTSNATGPGGALDATSYTPGVGASGIYRIRTGEYVVVLDGTLSLTGVFEGSGFANKVSAVNDYIDVWTVKKSATANYSTVINDFHLHDDTFFVVTEPLLLKTSNRLVNKKIPLGSKTDMKIETDVFIENKNIDATIRNIFKDSVITSGMVQILKINENEQLAGHVEVSAYSDTSAGIRVTSENTLIHTFDTNELLTHAKTAAGTLGSIRGVYALRVKYTLLSETIVTPLLFFQII